MCEPFKPITREEAAEILSVSLTTLDELVKAGALPAPRALGGQRRLYWHPAVFYSYLERALTTGEPEAPCDARSRPQPPAHAPSTRSVPPEPGTPAVRASRRGPSPKSTHGRPDVRAREAERLRKLNH